MFLYRKHLINRILLNYFFGIFFYFLLTDLKIGWKFILFYLPEKSDRFWWQQTLQINWMIQLMHWVLLSALLQKALRVTKMEYNQTPMKIQSWTLWGSSAAYTCKYFTNLIHKVIMWMQILNWNLEKKKSSVSKKFHFEKKYIEVAFNRHAAVWHHFSVYHLVLLRD